MKCRKCEAELTEGSLFCNRCGTKLKPAAEAKPNRGSRKWVVAGAAAAALAVAGFAFFLFSGGSPVTQYKKAVADSRYEEANVIYDEKIHGDLKKEMAVDAFIQADLDATSKDFANSTLDYATAMLKLDTLEKTRLLKSENAAVRADIERLNDSRIAFQSGKALLLDKKTREALAELKKVSSEDSENYANAQELIQTTSNDYKAEMLKQSEALATEMKYDEAITALNGALAILSKDVDLTAKKAVYEKQLEEQRELEREKKMKELRDNQQLTIVDTRTFTDWTDNVYVSIIVRNNTDKVVKSYSVGWMGYDKDGFPVKTGWLSPDFLKIGNAELNIQPSKTEGAGRGWQLTGGFDKTMEAAEFIACVKEVEFYDGTKWENEYYAYWVEQHMEKPLVEDV